VPRRLIDIALDELRGLVGSLASIASESLSKARTCLKECSKSTISTIHALTRDAYKLRAEVLDLATEIIARFQPVAADLRHLQALVSASYDFYRITRYSFEIARTVEILECTGCEMELACKTWETVENMMKLAREAILEMVEEKAREVMKLDAEVDEAYVTGLYRLKNSDINRCMVAEALILRHLERIADHLTYIASETVYAVRGLREYV